MSESLIGTAAGWRKDLADMIWRGSARGVPGWRGGALKAARITVAVGRDIVHGQLSLRATSLVFTTLLSLVPLLAVSFSVLKGFRVHNQMAPALNSLLAPLGDKGLEITEKIIGFVENVRADVIGSLGLALLIYTTISLMHKIELAFNYAWHISGHRTLGQRFSHYLSVVFVGPLLVFSSLAITATIVGSDVVTTLGAYQPFGWLIGLGTRALPYLMVTGAFTFVYVFMPNTRVTVRSAFVGALFAGLLWNVVGMAFASFVANSPNYTAIYSAFATLIVFMLWLYLGWLILLVGASIAFYHQRPEYMGLGPGRLVPPNRQREALAMQVMSLVGGRFYDGGAALSRNDIGALAGAPFEAVEEVLEALGKAGLLTETDGDPPTLMPAVPLEETPLITVLLAVRDDGEATAGAFSTGLSGPVAAAMGGVDKAIAKALKGRTIRDIIETPEGSENETRQDGK